MTIHVMLMGLDAGPHGMHVHMGTDCATPGEHLNPQNAPHGPANAGAGARHLGDLGNITADASGMVEEMLRDSLLGGDSTFIGKVIIVHEGQDDLVDAARRRFGRSHRVRCHRARRRGRHQPQRRSEPRRLSGGFVAPRRHGAAVDQGRASTAR